MKAIQGNSLIELLCSLATFLSVGNYRKATVFDPDPDRVPRPKAAETPGAPERSAHKWGVGVHKERVSCHIRLMDHAVKDTVQDRNAWTTTIIAFGAKMRDCITLERLAGSRGRVPITDADYDFIYPQLLDGFRNEFCSDLQVRRVALDAVAKAKTKLPKVSKGAGKPREAGAFEPSTETEEKFPAVLEFYHGAIADPVYPGYKWAGLTTQEIWEFIGKNQAVADELEAYWAEKTELSLDAGDLFRALELGLWESGRIPEGYTWEGGYKPETKSVKESTLVAAGLEEFSYKGKKAYRGQRQEIEIPA